jgi:Archaeal/vacuolar-type H+-ATPase subunit I
MIIKMKKLLLFLPNSETEIKANLAILGELGMVHITPFQLPKDGSIDEVDSRVKQLKKAIQILDQYKSKENDPIVNTDRIDKLTKDENSLLEKVLSTEKEYQNLIQEKKHLNENLHWFKDWGNIALDDFKLLQQKKVFIRLYLANDKDLKAISKQDQFSIVGKLNELHQIVFVTENKDQKLNLTEVKLPEYGKNEVVDLINQNDAILKQCQNLLTALSLHQGVLVKALAVESKSLDLKKVEFSGQKLDNQIVYWKGYMPEESVENLIRVAEENSWGYVIQDPNEDETDEVPTLFKTAKWAEKIKPVMNFMGLVPGYKELDVSKIFMIFFTFFTGILVGDAGYGLVFLLITFLVHRKKKFASSIEFQLMYTLSAAIMIWGILTGTYFGSEAIAEISILNQLRIEKLASFGGDSIFIQKLMFVIGALHLSIGHLQMAWKYNNSIKALGQLGWVAIVWGLYGVVNNLVLGLEAQPITPYLFATGISMVALFSHTGSNFFKGMLSSLGNLPLSIINGFSDIISYIRLYAVGLSTVLMATSFNNMAIGDGVTTVVSGISAVIVLILGHGLNMVLAGMAVLVHGVRLNMLEYAGHASVEFSGREYKPFKLKK